MECDMIKGLIRRQPAFGIPNAKGQLLDWSYRYFVALHGAKVYRQINLLLRIDRLRLLV